MEAGILFFLLSDGSGLLATVATRTASLS